MQPKARTLKYEEWEAQIDAYLTRQYGTSLYDLPDCPTHDWYDEGFTVTEAARMVLEGYED